MADQVVKAGASTRLARVDGDLKVGRNARISAQSGGKVVVTGAAHFVGPVLIECDIECGSLEVEGRGYGPSGDVTIRGSLTVHGRADIDATAKVEGAISTEDLDVAGHLESGPIVSKKIRVGGHLTTKGDVKTGTLDVGGHMRVHGRVDVTDLRVGGHAEFEGGAISGEIKVRGHFKPSSRLDFGEIQVFGTLTLPAGSTGQKLFALGKVEFEGDADCRLLEISGSARVCGDCASENVEVKGKLDVGGSLRVAERLRIYGNTKAGGEVACGELGVLGKAEARSVTVVGKADIAGEVETRAGLKARSVFVGRGSKVVGPLVGDEIEVGKDADFGSVWGLPWWRSMVGQTTTVEDLHGGIVRLGQRSSAKRIFGKVVELKQGSMAHEVVYTEELRLPSDYFLREPPTKVEKLPDPPL
jgi:cytoskeletal protein CcmA (bactofilin family)